MESTVVHKSQNSQDRGSNEHILNSHRNEVLGHQGVAQKITFSEEKEQRQQGDVRDTEHVVIVTYKNFHDFFIGQTKELNKCMVFYNLSQHFTNNYKPIIYNLSKLNEVEYQSGVVDCNWYKEICSSHKIVDFPTMRWYSTCDDSTTTALISGIDNRGISNLRTEHTGTQSALWYKTTTKEELELYLTKKRNMTSYQRQYHLWILATKQNKTNRVMIQGILFQQLFGKVNYYTSNNFWLLCCAALSIRIIKISNCI
jgi:hypothetical protein